MSENMILTPEELQSWINEKRPFSALDIRPEEQRLEWPLLGFEASVNNPSKLPVANSDPLVLICQYGIVTEGMIIEQGLKNAFSLLGGAQAWEEFRSSRLDLSAWSRQIALPEVGMDGQRKLTQATVAIIGVGGLGCAAATTLAGAGVGRLILVDGDRVALSNLHRQPLFGLADQGHKKVVVAAERLKALNPELTIVAISEFLNSFNAEKFLSAADVIIDASDNLRTRKTIDYVSRRIGIPLVYGGLYRFEGQVAVLNHNGGPGYTDLFPGEIESGDPCSAAGTLGMLPGIIGNIQALEVVKLIVGIEPNLSGKLLLYNGLNHQTETIRI
ncbi:MAG: ThiF family adenylyltransferase [Fidelibacterota bacterium]